MSEPTTKRKKRPTTVPNIPTVATHGAKIDHAQIVEALESIAGFPVPPNELVESWGLQSRAEVLRWVNHTKRDTEPLPPVIEAWLTRGSENGVERDFDPAPDMADHHNASQTQSSEETAPQEPAVSEDASWLTAERDRVASGRYSDEFEKVRIDAENERHLTERLVAALKDLEEVEEHKRQETKRLGEAVKDLRETTNRLAQYIRDGWEEKPVRCQWWYDYTNGLAELRREDNGEFVKSRMLNEDERQLRMTVEDESHLLDAEAQPNPEPDADPELKALHLTLLERGGGHCPAWAEVNGWPVGVVQEVQNWLGSGGDTPEVLGRYSWANKPEGATPFCCRCKEDFPVATEPSNWSMGEMRLLKKAPKKIRNQFSDWIESEIHGEGYLCGNCYFDLTD